ncbi:MAG: saccharopine dehydrogenase NADP-binding domain-containing protein [Nannocystaceae bacterium]|nr:saccharopine dehydrogenase NADP-binding domain-containing protein [Myxococcales bacterium]
MEALQGERARTNRRPVIVVGGYGQVGRRIARGLIDCAREVVVAGRSERRSRRAAHELGCRGATLDVGEPGTWASAVGVAGAVVVCVDQTDDAFARWVLERGVDYIDITAGDAFLRKVERLDPIARGAGSTALLSVGLAPGVTNLLVKDCVDRLDSAEHARIALLLGVGERHGDAGIEWTLDQLARVSPIASLVPVRYPGSAASTVAVPLEIADQHVVLRTQQLRSAETVVTLESSRWTRVAVALGPSLRWSSVRALVRYLLPRVRLGSERCAVVVEVRGALASAPHVTRGGFVGAREVEVTARVAAKITDALAERRRPGVFHIDQLFDLKDIRAHVDGRWEFSDRASSTLGPEVSPRWGRSRSSTTTAGS